VKKCSSATQDAPSVQNFGQDFGVHLDKNMGPL
jgi:hypothetical protein